MKVVACLGSSSGLAIPGSTFFGP
jgi:hypothetical protein